MATKVLVLNGPNLNLLGKREPSIYGGKSLKDIEKDCIEAGKRLGLAVDFRQTNIEGVLVDWLQEAGETAAGVVLNPGGYTHTSVALQDAIRAIGKPVIEVHLSNIFAREPFRHHSYVSPVAAGIICGLGAFGYVLALEALKPLVAATPGKRTEKKPS
ncbi:MAG: type II 3-dehydroquinate dehydratase [Bauldia sp.]